MTRYTTRTNYCHPEEALDKAIRQGNMSIREASPNTVLKQETEKRNC